jgi:hypothetical protein
VKLTTPLFGWIQPFADQEPSQPGTRSPPEGSASTTSTGLGQVVARLAIVVVTPGEPFAESIVMSAMVVSGVVVS